MFSAIIFKRVLYTLYGVDSTVSIYKDFNIPNNSTFFYLSLTKNRDFLTNCNKN